MLKISDVKVIKLWMKRHKSTKFAESKQKRVTK